jgi:Na+-transporting NADH:ubiquinone oxidoreductase subunit C
MSAESTSKTLIVTLAVCIVCSVLVSSFAVGLKSRQEENKKLDKLKNILAVADLLEKDADAERINEIYSKKIKPEIINVESGRIVPKAQYTDILNIEDFDIKALAKNPKYNKEVPSEKDIANIKRMPQYMSVYFVKEDDKIQKVILPIYGKGLWETMYGFIALGNDLKTVKGFTFYEQGETPGLGGEVDNPRWKEQWKGKKAYGDDGSVTIEVVKKGMYDPGNPDDKLHKIDGLSGSTLTTRAVNNLVRFWLNGQGYRPFIDRLKKGD